MHNIFNILRAYGAVSWIERIRFARFVCVGRMLLKTLQRKTFILGAMYMPHRRVQNFSALELEQYPSLSALVLVWKTSLYSGTVKWHVAL